MPTYIENPIVKVAKCLLTQPGISLATEKGVTADLSEITDKKFVFYIKIPIRISYHAGSAGSADMKGDAHSWVRSTSTS